MTYTENDGFCNWPVARPLYAEAGYDRDRSCGRTTNTNEWPSFCWQHEEAALRWVARRFREGDLPRQPSEAIVRAIRNSPLLDGLITAEIDRRISEGETDDLPGLDHLLDLRAKELWSP